MYFSYFSLFHVILCFTTAIEAVILNSSVSVACPGETIMITCISSTGALEWSMGETTKLYNSLNVDMTHTLGIFKLTAVATSGNIVSTATIESVMSADNGATITCTDDITSLADSRSAVINVAAPPGSVANIQVVALSFTSLKLTWSSPAVLSRCVRRYVAEFFHGTESTVYSTVDSTTLLTVSGLTRGVHYSIAITARDGEGRVGTETARVPYTLDVLPPVENFMMSLVNSNGTHLVVHLQWMKSSTSTSYPPFTQYVLTSNITISPMLSSVRHILMENSIILRGTHLHTTTYYIQVVAHNMLGAGRSARKYIVIKALPQNLNQLNPTIYIPVLQQSLSPHQRPVITTATEGHQQASMVHCSTSLPQAHSLTQFETAGVFFVVLSIVVSVIALVLLIFLIRAKKASLMNTKIYAKLFIQRGEKSVTVSSNKQKKKSSVVRSAPGPVRTAAQVVTASSVETSMSTLAHDKEHEMLTSYEEVVDHTKKNFAMDSNPAYPHVYYS